MKIAMDNSRNKHTFSIYVFLFLILITYVIVSQSKVFATSPSFAYREVRNALYNVIDMNCVLHPQTRLEANCHTNEGNQSIDIYATDLFSDGKFLNATIWLLPPIKDSPSNSQLETNYGMYIDADDNPKTGWQGIDYQVEYSEFKNGTWTRTFYEFSSLGDNRILKVEKNYENGHTFYGKSGNYVTLFADLNAMGSPSKYRVMLYAEEIQNPSKKIWKDDFTNWIDIPKSQLTLVSTPSPVILRQGQQQPVDIQLMSNTDFVPTAFTVQENSSGVKSYFLQNKSYNEPASLKLIIPGNASVGTYNIPIIATITEKSTFPALNNIYLNLGNYSEQVILPVKVEACSTAYCIGELLNDFNKTWIEPISGIWTFVGGLLTGGISQLIYNRFKKNPIDNRQEK
jgi:hypothetical protein